MILIANINCDFESTFVVIFHEGYLKLFIKLDKDSFVIFTRLGCCLTIWKQRLYIGLTETLKAG